MTINGAVLPVMAMYIRAAVDQQMELGPERSKYSEGGGGGRGDSSSSYDKPPVLSELRGTIQNNVLKDSIVRNMYIYPPRKSFRRVAVNVMGYTSFNMPLFNSVRVLGYHM